MLVSHAAIRFQLALFWSTILTSLRSFGWWPIGPLCGRNYATSAPDEPPRIGSADIAVFVSSSAFAR